MITIDGIKTWLQSIRRIGIIETDVKNLQHELAATQQELACLRHDNNLMGLNTITRQHAIFGSNYLADAHAEKGILFKHHKVIYYGVDLKDFPVNDPSPHDGFRMLYVGRLDHPKGTHDIIEAMQLLGIEFLSLHHISLSIAGDGDAGYEQHLRDLVNRYCLEQHVNFLGKIPRDSVRSMYREFDAFLFTSNWPEPFGIVLLEAMASCMPVIAAPTGGAAEILKNGENCLTYSYSDPKLLSQKIAYLINNPAERARLADKARRDVSAHFIFDSTIDQIEEHLAKLVNSTW